MPILQHLATLVALETLSPITESSAPCTAGEVNYRKLGDSWGAVGRKLGNRTCGHLGQLVYMHVKILKQEVKALTLNYMCKNSETRGIVYGNTHTRKNFETRGTCKNSETRPDKNSETTPVKNPETRGGKIF